MTVQEYNDNVSELITALEIEEAMRPIFALKEDKGQWDELLERGERMKRICDHLFFELTNGSIPLTIRNRMKIVKLKRAFYPSLLRDLAKRYERKGRFQDAETVLLEARALGSQGADFLS